MSSDKMDMGRVASLISIVEGISKVAPGYTYISSEAMSELREINEKIRKLGQEKSGRPVTPAPVGDKESPAQAIPSGASEGDVVRHPIASQPIESVDAPETPEVTEVAPTSLVAEDKAQGDLALDTPTRRI